MPTLKCPHCGHLAHLSYLERRAGRNVNCPSCDQSFVVGEPPEQPAISPAIDVSGPSLGAAPGPVNVRQPARGQRKQSMLAPLEYNPNGATSAERYPNLFRYISIVESLEKFFFWILVAIGFIYFAVVNVSAIGHFLDGNMRWCAFSGRAGILFSTDLIGFELMRC
ncbi:MAG TPA: hypothetical protein EYQ75_02985 [Planctomycetaceae bacterium]|nr:hypothetical protein [Planctomycetaceae bacterium]